MSEHIKSNYWRDVLDTVYQKDEIPESIRQTNGIIALTNHDKNIVYPTFQFKANSNYEVIPLIARAWRLITAINIKQLGLNEWAEVAKMLIPHESLNKQSYVDILSDSTVSEKDIRQIDSVIIDTANRYARTNGIEINLPKDFYSNYHTSLRVVKN